MYRFFGMAILTGLFIGAFPAAAQASSPAPAAATGASRGGSGPRRAGAPTRDPHTAGFVAAAELPDGNFIVSPTHPAAPEMTARDGVPQGDVFIWNTSGRAAHRRNSPPC